MKKILLYIAIVLVLSFVAFMGIVYGIVHVSYNCLRKA